MINNGKLPRDGVKLFNHINSIANIYQKTILEPQSIIQEIKTNNFYKVIVELMNGYLPFKDWIPPILAFTEKFALTDYLNL